MTKISKIPKSAKLEPYKNEYKEIYDFFKSNLNEDGVFIYRSEEDELMGALKVGRNTHTYFKTAYSRMRTDGVISVKNFGTNKTKEVRILKEWDDID